MPTRPMSAPVARDGPGDAFVVAPRSLLLLDERCRGAGRIRMRDVERRAGDLEDAGQPLDVGGVVERHRTQQQRGVVSVGCGAARVTAADPCRG